MTLDAQKRNAIIGDRVIVSLIVGIGILSLTVLSNVL